MSVTDKYPDIVEELRADADAGIGWAASNLYRAAAEIERLTADNAHWQRIAGQGIQDEHALRVEIERLNVEIEHLRAVNDFLRKTLYDAIAAQDFNEARKALEGK